MRQRAQMADQDRPPEGSAAIENEGLITSVRRSCALRLRLHKNRRLELTKRIFAPRLCSLRRGKEIPSVLGRH